MPFDKLKYPEELWEERRRSVQQSLRTITIDELKKIAKEHDEEFIDNPWRDEFLRLMAEQPHATFYHAVAQEDAEVLYCRDADFGFWVVPGSGIGPLDATGKRLMKEAIEGSLSGQKIGGKK
jgi:hypothetical protein